MMSETFAKRFLSPRPLLTVAIVLVVSFCLVDLLFCVLLLNLQPLPLSRSLTVSTPPARTTQRPALPAREIAGRGVFRTLSFFDAKKDAATQSSTSGLRLAGILGGGASGRAVIEEGDRQLLLKKGDSVAGFEIIAISAKGVRLRNQERELLLRPEAGRGQAPAGTAPAQGAAKNDSDRELSMAEIGNELQNLHSLLAKIRVTPHFAADGRPAGLRVVSVLPGSLLHRAGIENDDIVRAVNNAPILSPDDMILFYNNLKTGVPITLSLLRNDRQTEITIRIRK